MTDLSWSAKTILSVILMLIDLTGAWYVDPNHLYRMDAKINLVRYKIRGSWSH